jgi:biopolymer transport protein ExbD
MPKEPEKLSAAQRSKVRRLSAPKELAADEEGGELNIVPFLDIIMNVLMFVLATVSVTFTATTDTTLGGMHGGGGAPNKASLGLTVFIVADGFSVKASGGNVAPGCTGAGAGLAVPRRNGEYDYPGLNHCADMLKHASAEFEDETHVAIIPNPDVAYQTVISTMDALRAATKENDPTKEITLFPEVNFGVAR